MKSVFPSIGIFVALLFSPLYMNAQISSVNNPTDSLTIINSPLRPNANEDVTLSLIDYSIDINPLNIIWYVNDMKVTEGIGKKSLTVNVGKIGTRTKVTVKVISASGSPITQSIVLSASNVNFLWEAKTFTPPFYEGKALFTPQSNITVTAIPEFTGQNKSSELDTYIYKWTLDDYVLDEESGYGKKSVTFSGNYWGRDEKLKVAITSKDGVFSTEKTLIIHSERPKVLIYENNPLLGLLTNHAITDSFILNEKSSEVSFFAAPYFFQSNILTNGGTTYKWSMNGKLVPENNGNTITFRNDTGSTGNSIASIDIEQKNMNFDNGSASFSIEYK